MLLTSQSCVFRYSFFMVFDLCNCRQPLSEAKIITDHLTHDTGMHAMVLFLKPSACCCFHNLKIEAVLSEQDRLGFDWTQREKEREETGLGKAQVCQMPAITCLYPSFHHL